MTSETNDKIRHDLDLILMDDGLIAFFCVVTFDKSIDVTELGSSEKKIVRNIVPLFYQSDRDHLTVEERLRLADAVQMLGRNIRNVALTMKELQKRSENNLTEGQ